MEHVQFQIVQWKRSEPLLLSNKICLQGNSPPLLVDCISQLIVCTIQPHNVSVKNVFIAFLPHQVFELYVFAPFIDNPFCTDHLHTVDVPYLSYSCPDAHAHTNSRISL